MFRIESVWNCTLHLDLNLVIPVSWIIKTRKNHRDYIDFMDHIQWKPASEIKTIWCIMYNNCTFSNKSLKYKYTSIWEKEKGELRLKENLMKNYIYIHIKYIKRWSYIQTISKMVKYHTKTYNIYICITNYTKILKHKRLPKR